MKGRLLSMLFIVFCLNSFGQNTKEHYLFKPQEKGALFHLLGVELFENEEGSPLEYDLTYTSWDANLRMNFTYYDKLPLQIDSMALTAAGAKFSGKTKRLYVEPKNSKTWEHRYTIVDNVENFYKVYSLDQNPIITLYSDGEAYDYNIKKSAWKRYSPIGAKIFQTMRLYAADFKADTQNEDVAVEE